MEPDALLKGFRISWTAKIKIEYSNSNFDAKKKIGDNENIERKKRGVNNNLCGTKINTGNVKRPTIKMKKKLLSTRLGHVSVIFLGFYFKFRFVKNFLFFDRRDFSLFFPRRFILSFFYYRREKKSKNNILWRFSSFGFRKSARQTIDVRLVAVTYDEWSEKMCERTHDADTFPLSPPPSPHQ